MTNFLVVNIPLIYYGIIKQPTLNALRAIAFTYHLAIKFLTIVGVNVVFGNKVEAQIYYMLSMNEKSSNPQKTNIIENSPEALKAARCLEN